MKNCRLHIVGLPFYEVGDCLGDFFAEAMSRAMTLRPEPTNVFDSNSICAYDWQGRKVGYVSHRDQREAWQALLGSGRRSLRGRIYAVDAEHKCVMFECRVGTLGEVPDLYPQGVFHDWVYTGPVLRPTQEMVTLEYMMDEICDRMSERDHWGDTELNDFTALLMRFCHLSKYDLSGDMSDYCRRISIELQQTGNDHLTSLADELMVASGRAGRETHGGEVLDYWMRVLYDEKALRQLMVHRYEYDLETIHKQLCAFPHSMFNEWVENRENFVCKLRYMHVPREVLWRLISGIAFYEAVTARIKEQKKQTAETVPADGEEMVLKGKNIGSVIVSLPHSQIDQLSIGDQPKMNH